MADKAEKEKERQWREKITTKLESLKEFQTKDVAELIKAVKAWEVAINAAADACGRVGALWMNIADTIGRDSEWGAAFLSFSDFHRKMVAQEELWARTLEEKLAMPITVTQPNEAKQIVIKERDVTKALKKYETVVKTRGTLARKGTKKGAATAMEEYNEYMKEIEAKREMIWNDVQWYCQQSFFMLAQAGGAALKEKGDFYEKGTASFQQALPAIEKALQLTPDSSLHVNTDNQSLIYGDSDDAAKEKKTYKTMRRPLTTATSASTGDLPPLSPNSGAAASGEQPGRSTRPEEALTTQTDVSIAPKHAGQVSSEPSGQGAPQKTRVKAKWAFLGEREGELSMNAGDVLTIEDQSNPNWWLAEYNGARGMIPANYVEVLPPEPEMPPPPAILPSIPHQLIPSPGSNGLQSSLSAASPRRMSAGASTLPRPLGGASTRIGGPSPRPVSIMPGNVAPVTSPQLTASLGTTSRSSIGATGPRTIPTPTPALTPPPLPDLPPPISDLPPPIVDLPPPEVTAEMPLPPPPVEEPPQDEWVKYFTTDGHPYMYNTRTGESRWA